MIATAPGPLVGKGLTSDVFAWEDDRVLKLFFDWMPRARIEVEFEISRAVHKSGYTCPAPYELIERDGRIGIVFERIEGISMFRAVQAKPWLLRSVSRELAELHAQMHGIFAPRELPTQREQFERWINTAKDLSSAQTQAARQSLETAPGGTALCHGDFHPQNILYSPKGPIIIDWITGTRGDPIADVARTSCLFLHANIPPGTPFHMRLLIRFFRKLVNQIYLHRYFQLRPGSPNLLQRYEPLQLAATSAWRAMRVN
jgi:uncharacterized protein (TIGR02172 family)